MLLRSGDLRSADGLGEYPSTLGRPSDMGDRTLSGVARPRITGTWLLRLSLGEVARVSFVHAVDREELDGERASRSLRAAWSKPRFVAASNSCLSASSSERGCDGARACESDGLGVGDWGGCMGLVLRKKVCNAGAECGIGPYAWSGEEPDDVVDSEGVAELEADGPCREEIPMAAGARASGTAARCLRKRAMKPLRPGVADAGGLGSGAGALRRGGSPAPGECTIGMGSVRSARLGELPAG